MPRCLKQDAAVPHAEAFRLTEARRCGTINSNPETPAVGQLLGPLGLLRLALLGSEVHRCTLSCLH